MQHFEIKSLLTPYASEYFVLLVLETMFSPEMSEKLLVCLYIFAFGLAFRYLVNGVAERAGPWMLAAIPFCMHNLVYMGFMNYCIAVTLAMFLAGYWTRHAAQLNAGRFVLLLAAFLLMLLTHPIPVAVFLMFAGLHWAAEVLRAAPEGPGLWAAVRARVRQAGTIAALGVTAVLWLSLYVKPSSASAAPKPVDTEKVSYLANMLNEARLSPLVPFISPVYRAGLLLLVAVTVAALLAGLWKHRSRLSPAAIATVTTSAICFTLYAVVPISINGSFFFPQRFPIFWIVFLFAAAAAFRPPRGFSQAAGAIAIAATCIVLPLQWINVSQVNAVMSAVLDSPAAKPGSVGVVIGELPPHPKGFAFDPFFWGGAHYFRRSHAIMANAPWLDLPIIMLRPAHPDRWYNLSAWSASEGLSEAVRQGRQLPELSFVLRQQPAEGATASALLGLGWRPLPLENDILGIYTRPPADSAPVVRGSSPAATLRVRETR